MVTLFIFATVLLLLPSTLSKWPSPVKYAIMMTGIIIGIISSAIDDFSVVMFFVLTFVYYLEKHAVGRIVFYTLFQLNIVIFLWHTLNMDDPVILGLITLINLMVFVAAVYKKYAIQYGAFIIGFLAFFSLTVLDLSFTIHIVYTTLFFLVSTSCVYYFRKQNHTFYWISSLVFWFMLIAQLYYDLAWKLIHKSLLLLVLGILFLLVSSYLDKRTSSDQSSYSMLKGKRVGILFIILLQVAWIGYQVYSNETLLQNGETIKLELRPVDPRSLLQGDYVELNYTISQLEDSSINENGPITIVLRKDAQGIHQYAGIYKYDGEWNTPYAPKEGDVLLNGKVTKPWGNANQITYGIEHFFIPEGTGLEIEGKVKYAVVKVSDKGNAILESLK